MFLALLLMQALAHAGCNASVEHAFCAGLDPQASVKLLSTPTPLCHCDDGWSGADCSKLVAGAARVTSNSDVLRSDPSRAASVICSDGVSSCPAGSTCAQYVTGMWGCCPLPNATTCDYSFGPTCCPAGHLCAKDGLHGGPVCYVPVPAPPVGAAT